MGFVIETCIKVLLVVLIFFALAGFSTYIERKVLAFFQFPLYRTERICYNTTRPVGPAGRYAPVAQLDRVTDSDVSAPFG